MEIILWTSGGMTWLECRSEPFRSNTRSGGIFFFLSSVLKAFLWFLAVVCELVSKGFELNEMLECKLGDCPSQTSWSFLSLRGHACEGWSGAKWNPTLVVGCEMLRCFFSLWVSHLWIPAHRSLRVPELTHPPCYLPVAGANSSKPALHPHPSLHITVTQSHSGPVPTAPRQQWEP